MVKSKIEADKALLGSLRETADKQSAIVLLQEQADRDFETLEESIRDRASDLMRFNLQPKQKLPSGADGDAYATLVSAVDEIGKLVVDNLANSDFLALMGTPLFVLSRADTGQVPRSRSEPEVCHRKAVGKGEDLVGKDGVAEKQPVLPRVVEVQA